MSTVDGWAMLYNQTRRFVGAVTNPGRVTDELIAYAYTEALHRIHNVVLESYIPWAVKNAVIDDTASSFGTEVTYRTHRYFFETDLGLTDIARVRRITRQDPDNNLQEQPLHHVTTSMDIERVRDVGSIVALMGQEGWIEDGDDNANGTFERSLRIFNKGLAMQGGHLAISYWFDMPLVTPSDFFEVDSSGNLTNAPPLPRKLWHSIMNYGHLIILETVEDHFKSHALYRRFNGTHGILDEVRGYLSRFQTDQPDYLPDPYAEEGV